MRPQPIRLSLNPPLIRNLRIIQGIVVGIALIGVGLSTWSWLAAANAARLALEYESARTRVIGAIRIADEEMKRAGLEFGQAEISATKRDVTFANQLAEKHDFSWTELLANLERGIPANVSITSVRLNFKDSTVVLSGTVHSMTDLNQLVSSLQEEGTFRHVGLIQHQIRNFRTPIPDQRLAVRSKSQDTSSESSPEEIDFTLSVFYRPQF